MIKKEATAQFLGGPFGETLQRRHSARERGAKRQSHETLLSSALLTEALLGEKHSERKRTVLKSQFCARHCARLLV